jgi:hypothetical protein
MLPIEENKKYVKLDNSNLVITIISGSAGLLQYDETDPLTKVVDSSVIVDCDYTFDGTNFIPPVLVENTIDISGPVELVRGSASDFVVEVRNDSNIDTSFNGTYYVPLMNKLSGTLAAMLKIVVVNGTCSVPVTIADSGMYAINFSKITPALTKNYKLTGVKEIVVL